MFYAHKPQSRKVLPQFVSEYLNTVANIRNIKEELKHLSTHPDKYKVVSNISDLLLLKASMLEKKDKLLKHFKFLFVVT
jgi:hypothetical protein